MFRSRDEAKFRQCAKFGSNYRETAAEKKQWAHILFQINVYKYKKKSISCTKQTYYH